MAMPPVEGVLDRWDFYEKKGTGNPQQDQSHIRQVSSIMITTRSQMKFYKSSSNNFAFKHPDTKTHSGLHSGSYAFFHKTPI